MICDDEEVSHICIDIWRYTPHRLHNLIFMHNQYFRFYFQFFPFRFLCVCLVNFEIVLIIFSTHIVPFEFFSAHTFNENVINFHQCKKWTRWKLWGSFCVLFVKYLCAAAVSTIISVVSAGAIELKKWNGFYLIFFLIFFFFCAHWVRGAGAIFTDLIHVVVWNLGGFRCRFHNIW